MGYSPEAKQRRLEYSKRWRKEHPEYYREYHKKWDAAHPERKKETTRRSYIARESDEINNARKKKRQVYCLVSIIEKILPILGECCFGYIDGEQDRELVVTWHKDGYIAFLREPNSENHYYQTLENLVETELVHLIERIERISYSWHFYEELVDEYYAREMDKYFERLLLDYIKRGWFFPYHFGDQDFNILIDNISVSKQFIERLCTQVTKLLEQDEVSESTQFNIENCIKNTFEMEEIIQAGVKKFKDQQSYLSYEEVLGLGKA